MILRSSADWDFKSGKQFPPLRFDNVPWQPDVYFVIAQYYQAIADYTGDKIHPLSFGPHSIINTADAILELQVLAVSVAAESLIEAAFPQIVTETQDFLNDVESLSNRIENLGISTDRLKARLKGVLREFPKARNSDRLRKFVEKYGLEQRLFKDSWQSLRNLAAHGGMIPPNRLRKDHL